MKKIFLLILPCFFCLAFFCGCGKTTESDIANENLCYFNASDNIELSINGQNNSTTAKLEVLGDITPNFWWNNEIIDYDINTGLITAISTGSTNLIASYYNESGNLQQTTLNINVTETIYAQDIELESEYVYKLLDEHNTAPIKPQAVVNGQVNNDYNLGFTFKSDDEDIFTVNADGDIFPISTGSANLIVMAVFGFDETANKYTYIEKTTTIIVENVIENFEVSIVDANLEPVVPYNSDTQVDYYNLYYGTKVGSDKPNYYYIKISSDKPIYNCLIQTTSEYNNLINQNQNLIVTDVKDLQITSEIFDNGKTVCLPFVVRDAGVEAVEYRLIDSVMNFFQSYSSKIMLINVYQFMQDIEENVAVYNGEENSSNMVNLNKINGVYTLYLLGGNEEQQVLARQNGFYNKAILTFKNLSNISRNLVSIYIDEQLVDNSFDISRQALVVEPRYKGITKMLFVANDGSGWQCEVNFQFLYCEPTSYTFVDNSEPIELIYGLEGYDEINLDVTNIQPAYAYHTVSVYSSSQNIPVEINGTKLKAIQDGECYVVVTLNGEISKSYKIIVNLPPARIDITTTSNAVMEIGDVFIVEYKVYDENGKELNLTDIDIILKDANDNIISNTNDFIIKKGATNIAITALNLGKVKFELISKYNQVTSTEITVACV